MDFDTLVTFIIIAVGVISYLADAAKKRRARERANVEAQRNRKPEAPEPQTEEEEAVSDILFDSPEAARSPSDEEHTFGGEDAFESLDEEEEEPAPISYQEVRTRQKNAAQEAFQKPPEQSYRAPTFVLTELPAEQVLMRPSSPAKLTPIVSAETPQPPELSRIPEPLKRCQTEAFLMKTLLDPVDFRTAWLLKEILSPPLTLRLRKRILS